ncbi:hypothetical protein CRYUN_Cryun41cG0046100 [Craigia yunnanensis]
MKIGGVMGPITITFLMLLFLESFILSFSTRNHNLTCIQSERQALLRFKHYLKDPSNRLAAWTKDGDCCKWDGIVCSNVTGHVIKLHLRSYNCEAPQRSKLGDLSSNDFRGPIPRLSSNVIAIDISKNSMSGSTSHFFCYKVNELMKLEVLNLGDNLLSGEIPDCWKKRPRLVGIKFCSNNFSGKIPNSIGTLTSLQSLHIPNNSLVGEIPSSLKNCSELLTVDFGANQLSGDIPPWMGERLSKLIILSLHTNKFDGTIPEELCALSSLQVLDLSHNSLSSDIPSCINNLSAMASRNKSGNKIFYKTSKGSFFENIILVMKGRVVGYSTTLKLVKTMDLSDNNLSGEIPEKVTTLAGLQSLNLSNNLLVGSIPDNIGAMGVLECVDLSANNLSGEIPESMSELSFLSYLNLSNNKLTGKIPSGTQLQSFTAASFLGTKLYGPPLTTESRTSKPVPLNPSKSVGENVDDGPKVDWFYLCVEFGFLFGFLGVAGRIMFSESWDLCIFNFWKTFKKIWWHL